MEFENVKSIIKNSLTDAYVEVQDMTGTRDHLDLLIVSDQFKGKMLIQQHQMVMNLLKESLKSDIHAVQLKTMSFEDAQRDISTLYRKGYVVVLSRFIDGKIDESFEGENE